MSRKIIIGNPAEGQYAKDVEGVAIQCIVVKGRMVFLHLNKFEKVVQAHIFVSNMSQLQNCLDTLDLLASCNSETVLTIYSTSELPQSLVYLYYQYNIQLVRESIDPEDRIYRVYSYYDFNGQDFGIPLLQTVKMDKEQAPVLTKSLSGMNFISIDAIAGKSDKKNYPFVNVDGIDPDYTLEVLAAMGS